MITQAEQRSELKVLAKRREELRLRLKDHFCLPVSQRNYKEFEMVVDELDEVREKMYILKAR